MRRLLPAVGGCFLLLIAVPSLLPLSANVDDQKFDLSPVNPLSPKEELATFRTQNGFRIELVACEPAVIDPVGIAFDEDGRLFAVEMIGYPNDGTAEGRSLSGRIKLLEDRDGDGYYETGTVYADGFRFPTSVMPWKGGLLVADAPSILYVEDTKGTGKADRRETLYTGFGLGNVEQLINGLQWGLDNWVYGCAASGGGMIRSVQRPDTKSIDLRNRGVRFHPEIPGSLQPTSGGGQFGLAGDDWEQWFVNTNAQHLRHIVLPDHYLQRNPYLTVSAVTLDIPDHGAACAVYRISPFEAWRVERTRRRSSSPEARRFPSTELVPGGYVTSGTGPVVYTADLFPSSYRGNTFMCDPANNLIHHDVLVPQGATFIAKRGEEDHEFLASTDIWFRPVFLTVGPDGAIYVCDFYREIIEHPASLPDDIKQKLNLGSRGRGRIWRIVPEGTRPVAKKPALRKAPTEELVKHLSDGNSWWRLTAQRLLVERQDQRAVQPLEQLAQEAPSALGRAHALWTLQGLKALKVAFIERALKDPDAGVREQALRLAEEHLRASPSLRSAAAALADDPSPRVRFQLAFTLGEATGPEVAAALAKLARQDGRDPWAQTAILSSTAHTAPDLLETLARDPAFVQATSSFPFLMRLAALIGAGASEADLSRVLAVVTASGRQGPQAWQVAVLEGLGQGMRNRSQPLERLWDDPPPALKSAVEQIRPAFQAAAAASQDGKRPTGERLAAVRLLASGPFATAAPALQALLSPQTPGELQMTAVRSLAAHADPKVADILLASWNGYSPEVRREAVEALFGRPERLLRLLSALEEKRVAPGQLEPVRLQQLRESRNRQVRQQAQTVLAGQVPADRRKVLDDYKAALDLKADASHGRVVFQKNCATCHRLDNMGVEVGADLLAALRTKTPESLLLDILDPSREVDPRFLNYTVVTKNGQTFTGIIAAETASSITLRRAEKAEDTILRDQIAEDGVQASTKSLMPEGLEAQLSKQDVADVIAFLLSVAAPKK
jgi:putative membrane-bound dehydrogenase-like protein